MANIVSHLPQIGTGYLNNINRLLSEGYGQSVDHKNLYQDLAYNLTGTDAERNAKHSQLYDYINSIRTYGNNIL